MNILQKAHATDASPTPNEKLLMLNRLFAYLIIGGLLVTAVAGGFYHAATTLLWALACLAIGAFIGLLFGIPRVKSGRPNATDPASGAEVNNNLIEVSDWLTKIIVGVGLVQLTSLPGKLKSVASPLAQTLTEQQGGLAAAIGIILFFSFAGFLFGFINTRTFIAVMLVESDRQLNGVEAAKKIEALATAVDLLDQNGNGSRPGQSLPVPEMAAEGAGITGNDDPHKGNFGGLAETNGRALRATIKPWAGSQSSACWIDIRVVSTDPQRPLKGTVSIYLHPSFGAHQQHEVAVKNGEAQETILSWGAFTIGATADGGQTRLELDLTDVPGGNQKFYEL